MFRKSENPLYRLFKEIKRYFKKQSKLIKAFFTLLTVVTAIVFFNDSRFSSDISKNFYSIYGKLSNIVNDLYLKLNNITLCRSNNLIDIEILRENNDLKLQNTILNEKLDLLKSKIHFTDNNKYKYITAIVTQVTYPKDEMAFVVSAGEKDGVRVGNVVIDDSGIVGRVSSITSDYSVISLIGNENVKISAIVTGKELDCIVGKKIDKNHLEINYLSDLEAVSHRDKVISSGKDGFTPYGIEIGTIDKSGSKVSLLVKNRSKSTTIVKIIINESLNL